ncbi:D-2-hydroxyacid dehydrogenase [Rhodohalobacter halophilus]|uniref:D-2-hydroxyacid dehydrogenase n=1 Tax=Rhodohalobacter halophilus TaxID=1812810 RepID=UPI000AA9EB92|nr:D-2-hydroxyacid dehydrogenase [Rhodohalobacter halophilus]
MKIVFLDTKTVGTPPNLDQLKKLGEVTFYPSTRPDQTEERIKDADIVITNKVVLNDEMLSKYSDQLKMIAIAATGMNNVDMDAAEKYGVAVKNVAGYATHSVAQSTFAMLFRLMQDLDYYDVFIKSGDYTESEIFTNTDITFHELRGKLFGIIGLGTIGQKVAQIAEAFDAEVVYYSTSGKNTDQPYKRLELDEMMETSDVVSIHAPFNENTDNLIAYEQIKKMKSSAILINTGRGRIVNEADLAKAIDEGLIAGAALDVFENEPMEKENPLLRVKNSERLLLTPHITWSSVEARTELIDGVYANIKEFLDRRHLKASRQ